MNKVYICDSDDINLEASLDGGQAFRWWGDKEKYRGVIRDNVYIISKENSSIYIENLTSEINNKSLSELKVYLGLNFNLKKFTNHYKEQNYIYKLILSNQGLRILHQDPWEATISFITSSVSNVLKIKNNINKLSSIAGNKIGEGMNDYTFPTAKKIFELGESELRKIGFGFRSPYIIDAAYKNMKNQIDFQKLREIEYEKCLNKLLEVKGIGKKVADCIMAYGLGRRDVFPVDRWVRRGLVNRLKYKNIYTNEKLSDLARIKFKNDSAYIQQYIFYGEKTS